ncbi:cytochrome P450 [Mytilinidion resinicola]|uniref:Cytochrome P450 n=1 Tax=Mytilinidion resinicola TaxID=574789 RepID=A0A6A6Z4B5_9PEZI|nr:cytochrome P450 [Mytilinidion resinicola]KAF2815493.1 cytochrome P450 [Mytilinidion resinicola]
MDSNIWNIFLVLALFTLLRVFVVQRRSLLVSLFLHLLHPIRDRQGRQISGPPWIWANGHMIDKFLDGRAKSKEWRAYGAVYRIWSCGIPEIVITTAEDVRAFHSDSDQHAKSRSSNGGWFFHQLLGECMGLINGSRWKEVRGEFQHAFTHRAVMDMSPSISQYARDYVKDICSESSGPIVVHAANTLAKFPFFCTAKYLYGPLSREEKDELWALGQRNLALMRYVLAGGIYRFAMCRLFCTGTAKELDVFRRDWSNFNEKIYQTRRTSSPACLIVSIWKPVKEGTMKESEVLQTISEMLFANLDVSSHVLTWFVTLLAENTEVQQRLREEVESSKVSGVVSGEYCNSKDSLLRSCWLESLRLRPFTSFAIPESSPSPKILGGYQIPANASIVVDTHSINIENPLWGADTHQFRPERFAVIKPSELRYNFFAFGFGTRKCLGQHFAESMLKTFVVHLLDHYTVSIPSPSKHSGSGDYDLTRDSWVPTSNVHLILTKI